LFRVGLGGAPRGGAREGWGGGGGGGEGGRRLRGGTVGEGQERGKRKLTSSRIRSTFFGRETFQPSKSHPSQESEAALPEFHQAY